MAAFAEADDERGVEGRMGAVMGAQQKAQAFHSQQMQMRREENEEDIHLSLQQGEITAEEAARLRARAKMHQDQDKKERTQVVNQAQLAAADYETTDTMLEQILNADKAPRWKKALGLHRLDAAMAAEERRRSRPDFKHPMPRLHRVVSSTAFELVVCAGMGVNAVLIGFQVSEEESTQFQNLEYFFTFAFLVEVVLRVLCDSWPWLCHLNNAGDVLLIVVTGLIPMILTLAQVDPGILRMFAVLRVLRLIRLVRLVRTYKAFRILWTLIRGLAESGRILLWTFVLITVAIFILSVFSVYLIGRADVFKDDEYAQERFGSVPVAMINLFQVATLDSWTAMARPLMAKHPWVGPFFVVVIMIITLALLNLVTAVIVNNAFERGKQDEELHAVMKLELKEAQIKELIELFHEIDEDGSGFISKEEYDNAVQNNENVRDKFTILEVSGRQYQDIWELLDDGSGEVGVDAFADCIRAMQGETLAKDSFSILRRVGFATTKMRKLGQQLRQQGLFANALEKEVGQMKHEFGLLLVDMCDLVKLVGDCIPDKALPVNEETREIADWDKKMRDRVKRLM